MSEEKPLHVRVAEALGCVLPSLLRSGEWFCECSALVDREECLATGYSTGGIIPRYDTDWSATGPLIERFKLTVMVDSYEDWHACEYEAHEGIEGTAEGSHNGLTAEGPTPLVAVCYLILALKEAGKL